MFTGIITDIGAVRGVEDAQGGRRFSIGTAFDLSAVDVGASISCAGVCLTATSLGDDWFSVDVSPESLAKTTLGDWQVGRPVNLEQALKLGDELGGHLVSGHVDGVGEISDITRDGDNRRIRIATRAEDGLAQFFAQKGSVTVDGVSLTINAVSPAAAGEEYFEVNVIPHTLTATTLGELSQGSKVNLEVDLISRYLARIAEFGQ